MPEALAITALADSISAGELTCKLVLAIAIACRIHALVFARTARDHEAV